MKLENIIKVAKREIVFFAAFFLTIITSFFTIPKIEYINFKVLILLFNLMVISSAFEKLKILDFIALKILSKSNGKRNVSFIIIGLTFFSSMLLTNDVALLTFVPLTLIIAKRAKFNPVDIIIFQTLAANIGSSLTPMGNPQNLFIYNFYDVSTIEFFKILIPFTVVGGIFVILLNFKIKNEKLYFKLENIDNINKLKSIVYTALFIVVILSVFGIISYKITLILTCICVLTMDRDLFLNVDYFLLGTFIFFFLFIGNVSNLRSIADMIKPLLVDSKNVLVASAFLSQVISNVPSSILIAGFTHQWRALLLGVDIGGMGTLIASLASVISYKLYIKHYDGKKYIIKFHVYNFLLLFIFLVAAYLQC